MNIFGSPGVSANENLNLHAGRILLLLSPAILLVLRILFPNALSISLPGEINLAIISIFSLAVLGLSYTLAWVRQNIYSLLIGLFLLIGLSLLYNIYESQFAPLQLTAFVVFILFSSWYINYQTHLLIYQTGLLILLVLVAFLTPNPQINPFDYVLGFVLINIPLFFLASSRINTIHQLIDRETNFHGLFKKLNEGVVQVDLEGKIIDCNTKMAEILGYTREEILTRIKSEDLVPEDDRNLLKEKLRERKTGVDGRYEMRMIRKDKTVIWVQISATPNFNKDGLVTGSTSIVYDITDKKSAALELDNYAQVLAQTNNELLTKSSELEQFADIASSDLRLPLDEVRKSAQILVDLIGPKDPLSAEYAQEIIGKVNHMQNLLNAILAYTDSSEGKMNMSMVSIKELLDGIAANMKQTLAENQTSLNYSELPTLLVDKLQMQRLFRNLIDNSITYRGPDPLEINISFSVNPENREYIFSLEDNGTGIKREDYEKIFNIFRKDQNFNENSIGMGLAVSKKIAANHDGRLWFTSNVGKGTCYFLSLPIPRHENIEAFSEKSENEAENPLSSEESVYNTPPQNLQ